MQAPQMPVLTLPGVFAPISDSWLLASVAARHVAVGAPALDLCTGSGVVGVSMARVGADVTVVDVSRRALLTAWLNGRRNGAAVQVRRGRTFAPVAGRRFDLITANPPYVPSRSAELPSRGRERAWEAGPDGRLVLDEICDRAVEHLRPGGSVLLVHSNLIDEDATVARLEGSGLRAEIVAREHGPLGPLMRAQQRAGRIPADVAEEDVVVVRGLLPAD